MSRLQNNLGRGLDDLISEVSQVRAVPTRTAPAEPPDPEAPRPAPPPPAPLPHRLRLMPVLLAALGAALIACAILSWRLVRAEKRPPQVVYVEVPSAPEPMPAPAPGPPVPTPRDTRLDWAQHSGILGIRVEPGEEAARWVFDEPVFKSRAELRPGADELLRQAAAAMTPHLADCTVTVEGHTDNDPPRPGGPYRDNVALGYLRALAAADLLRDAGVPAKALRVTAPGEAHAPFPNTSPAEKLRNRTVTLRIERATRTVP